MRADGHALAQGVFPSGLECMLQVVAHPRGGVGVEAAYAGDFVAEALLGEDLGDAILGHPCLVAVPGAVHGETGLDREPAGEWCAVRDCRDPAATRRLVAGA
ncbi:MAG: hypothetical protein ACLP5E_06130 [Streptosporangiaceae bacterium]